MQIISSDILVGRETDLEALGGALDTALGAPSALSTPSALGPPTPRANARSTAAALQSEQAPQPSTTTILFGGEAGIGKTRLVDEFVSQRVGSRARVLRGQCIDFDSTAPPYAPIIGVLRALVGQLGADPFDAVAGSSRDALTVLLPELGGRVVAPETGQQAGAGLLFDAVAATLENAAAEHPLVVIIEDLHWADQATLALLRFLVRVIENGRILFVFTFRSDELARGGTLRAWLPELDRNRRVSRRELARLTRRQSRQLITALNGAPLDSSDVGVIFERTDGVPFFIEELVGCEAYLRADSFPETLREILLARYETMSEGAERLTRLLAAGGVRVEHELLSRVSEQSADEIDAAASEAVAANVLVVDDTAYRFRHSLVREAVHEQLLPGERVRFHTSYANALGPGDATAISYHWMLAHNAHKAFEWSITAMVQAKNSFAFLAAARLGERALEFWDQVADAEGLAGRSRVELLSETSYLLRNAGESERAIALINEALALCGPSGNAEPYARMLRDKASYLANVGQVGSIALLREALDVLHLRPQSVLRANILGELAARLMLEARFDEAIETADRALAEAVAVDAEPRKSVAANIRGISRFGRGDVEAGLADLALAGQLAGGNDSARLRYFVNQSGALNLLGRFDDSIRTAEEGAEHARQRGVERTSGIILLSNIIEPLFALGESTRANELLERALELDPPIGYSAHLQRLKLRAVLWSGDSAQAERLLRGWRKGLRLQLRIDMQSRLGFAAVAGEIALARGEIREAWSEVSVLLDSEHRSFAPYDLGVLPVAARVLAAARGRGIELVSPRSAGAASYSGSGSTLEAELREVLAAAAAWPTAAATVAVFDAELGGPRGSGTDPELWMLAVAASAASTAPAQLGPYTKARLAEAYANAGDRASARRWADEAHSTADRIGLTSVAQRVIDLKHRVGAESAGSARSIGSTGSAGRGAGSIVDHTSLDALLTERERQVLVLLAQGLSNRQIAEQLFISTKTASVHVSNILRKTGAATRTEAAYLARSGV